MWYGNSNVRPQAIMTFHVRSPPRFEGMQLSALPNEKPASPATVRISDIVRPVKASFPMGV